MYHGPRDRARAGGRGIVGSVEAEKAALRTEFRAQRAALRGHRPALARGMGEQLERWQPWREAADLGVFLGFGDEIPTEDWVRVALERGQRVWAPRLLGERMVFRRVDSLDRLERHRFGMLEPTMQAVPLLDARELHVLLVPGLAFDTSGARLGYGGGYYDRFVAALEGSKVATVGVVPEALLVSPGAFPVEEHDRRVRLLLTELGLRQPAPGQD